MRGARFAQLTTILAVAAVIAAPASLAGAAQERGQAAAPGVVLINLPAPSVCSEHRFTVGVWYQKSSGGSRAYRVAVSGPAHKRFFYRAGKAPSSHWLFWKVLAGRAGTYRTAYSSHRPGSKKWTTYVAMTRAHRCHGR
ncbi:MAG TPA: hypothetical protein VF162_04340 [Streptosporangiaceae bacterium]